MDVLLRRRIAEELEELLPRGYEEIEEARPKIDRYLRELQPELASGWPAAFLAILLAEGRITPAFVASVIDEFRWTLRYRRDTGKPLDSSDAYLMGMFRLRLGRDWRIAWKWPKPRRAAGA